MGSGAARFRAGERLKGGGGIGTGAYPVPAGQAGSGPGRSTPAGCRRPRQYNAGGRDYQETEPGVPQAGRSLGPAPEGVAGQGLAREAAVAGGPSPDGAGRARPSRKARGGRGGGGTPKADGGTRRAVPAPEAGNGPRIAAAGPPRPDCRRREAQRREGSASSPAPCATPPGRRGARPFPAGVPRPGSGSAGRRPPAPEGGGPPGPQASRMGGRLGGVEGNMLGGLSLEESAGRRLRLFLMT